MADPRHTLGQQGEEFVANAMQRAGYTIIARNWRGTQGGEIDIIADNGTTLVFVEVRTRRGPLSLAIEAALASVNADKQARVARLAEQFRIQHDLSQRPWRVDVAAVAETGGAWHLHVLVDALSW